MEGVPVVPDKAAHSVTLVLVHVVWSTCRRWRAIDEALDEPLHRSMKNKASELRATVHAFGAAPDHVHILVQLPGDSSEAADRVAGYLQAQRVHHATGHRGEPGGIVGPSMEPAFRRA